MFEVRVQRIFSPGVLSMIPFVVIAIAVVTYVVKGLAVMAIIGWIAQAIRR